MSQDGEARKPGFTSWGSNLTPLQALAHLEFAARPEGPSTLHINKQLLRQLLEPIRAALEPPSQALAIGKELCLEFVRDLYDLQNRFADRAGPIVGDEEALDRLRASVTNETITLVHRLLIRVYS